MPSLHFSQSSTIAKSSDHTLMSQIGNVSQTSVLAVPSLIIRNGIKRNKDVKVSQRTPVEARMPGHSHAKQNASQD